MGKDEQLQIKKDTLWQIHEKKQEIACLEKKLADFMDQIADVQKASDAGTLSAEMDHSVKVWHSTPARLPDPAEFSECIHDLDEAKSEMESLQRTAGNLGLNL